MLKILSIGTFSGLSNTCLHRHWALKKIANHVDEVNTTKRPISLSYKIVYRLFNYGLPISLPDNSKANWEIVEFVNQNTYDVIWIDKGITINASTLGYIKKKQPYAIIVSYTADNMAKRHNQSQNFLNCLPLYDVHITTKSYIINDLIKLGAKKVIFTNQAFESKFHYPRKLSSPDYKRLKADVGFVGMWEKERAISILFLAKNGINVRVFGGGNWKQYKNLYENLIIEDEGLFSEDYAKSFISFKISLCFLRKMNHDLQTSRTMEIPACGGFMMAERSSEHEMLFKEGKEAVFFSNDQELLERCRHYLRHEGERSRISIAGHKRCIVSGYSNEDTLKRILKEIQKLND